MKADRCCPKKTLPDSGPTLRCRVGRATPFDGVLRSTAGPLLTRGKDFRSFAEAAGLRAVVKPQES